MNNLQKIASAISGYEHQGGFASAKDHGYYDLKTEAEKIAYICTLSNVLESVEPVSCVEAIDIYHFLELPQNENDRWHAFENL